ncbi:hypothetical protein [Nonomuraea endophytica]|uniref:hypothetical protein n=1 Tax=Nonomuraea endophytica TaxID=714136 RepID=UPI0037CB8835
MTVDEALARLREELESAGVPTEDRDVWYLTKEPFLSLAPGLVVFVGVRRGVRWPMKNGQWQELPLDRLSEAAALIAPLYPERMSGVERAPQAAPV